MIESAMKLERRFCWQPVGKFSKWQSLQPNDQPDQINLCEWDGGEWVPVPEKPSESTPPHHVRHLANELVLALLQEFVGESAEDFPLTGGELARLRDTFERTIVETEAKTFPVVYYHPPGTLRKPPPEEFEKILHGSQGQVTALPSKVENAFAIENTSLGWRVRFTAFGADRLSPCFGRFTDALEHLREMAKEKGYLAS